MLLGITNKDTNEDLEYMVRKILRCRLWNNDKGESWRKSAPDLNLEILCVSQFTLYGHLKKGNKPDFHNSMKADEARVMYESFMNALRKDYNEEKIKDGVFQAMMDVSLVNDGPVTLVIESPQKNNGS